MESGLVKRRRLLLELTGWGLALLVAALLQRHQRGIERGLLGLPLVLLGFFGALRRPAGLWRWSASACALCALAAALALYPCPAWALACGACATLLSAFGGGGAPSRPRSHLLGGGLLGSGLLGILAASVDWRAGVLVVASVLGSWLTRRVWTALAVSGLTLAWVWLRQDLPLEDAAWFSLACGAFLCARSLVSLLAHPEARVRWVASLSFLSASLALGPALLARSPVGGTILAGPCLLLIALVAERRGRAARAQRGLRGVALAGTALACAGALLWARHVQPAVGGTDFFFYACMARDRVLVPDAVPLIQYGYSPGSYLLWESVFRLGGGLGALQWTWLALLGLVSSLTGWLAYVLSGSRGLCALGTLWSFRLLTHFDGLEACSEPWVALWGLIGLLVWRGVPLGATRGGSARALLLGLCLGFAVFCKQQGVLLAAAAALFLVAPLLDRRYSPWGACWGGVGLAGGYLVPILAEGRGLVPIERALGVAVRYQQSGSWSQNLREQVSLDPTLGLGVALSLLGLAWAARLWLLRARAGTRTLEPVEACLAFATLAWLLTLVQFQKRGYPHYAQLGAPFLVTAACCGGQVLAERLRSACGPAGVGAAALWLGSLLLWLPGSYSGFSLASLPTEQPLPQRPWHAPTLQADLERLSGELPKGSEVLVLPPGRNEVYFSLGARALEVPFTYGFGPEARLPGHGDMPWAKLEYVVVLLGESAQGALWELNDCQGLRESLPQHGYELVYASTALEVWAARAAARR